MKRDLINEDSNQFGPGTDLVICVLALLMVMLAIISFVYNSNKHELESVQEDFELVKKDFELMKKDFNLTKQNLDSIKKKYDEGGKFKLAERFEAATFEQKPYTKLTNSQQTESRVQRIIENYKGFSEEYPYIFVIGHANETGIEGKTLSYGEKLEWNWKIAGERSGVIANLIQEDLSPEQKNNIVIVSTGEFDLAKPEDPGSLENAYVEVVFGREWKPKSQNIEENTAK